MNRLADARAKLDWAKKHLDELARELNAWKQANGDKPPFTIKPKADPSNYSIAIVIDKVEDMPPSWGLRVGDILFNLRAALDYAAWQIVQVGLDPNPKNPGRVQFPIAFSNDLHWKSQVNDRLPGARQVHVDVVQRYQPYQARKCGEDPQDEPFGVLAELSRDDKHKRVTLLYTRHTRYRIRIRHLEGYVRRRVDTPPIGVLILAKPGTELGRIRGYPLVGNPTQVKVIVEIEGSSVIGFENGIGITGGLLRIGKTVGAFLTELEPFL